MVTKKCQIHATSPITCFQVPIIGSTTLNLTNDEIYKCLCMKAEVSEILPSGKMVRLDFTNYNKDNNPIIGEPKEEPIIIARPCTEPVETIMVTHADHGHVIEEEAREALIEDNEEPVIEEVIEEPSSEDELAEVGVHEEVSSNVKDYQVSSRNNNKNKKGKNNKR